MDLQRQFPTLFSIVRLLRSPIALRRLLIVGAVLLVLVCMAYSMRHYISYKYHLHRFLVPAVANEPRNDSDHRGAISLAAEKSGLVRASLARDLMDQDCEPAHAWIGLTLVRANGPERYRERAIPTLVQYLSTEETRFLNAEERRDRQHNALDWISFLDNTDPSSAHQLARRVSDLGPLLHDLQPIVDRALLASSEVAASQ